MDMFKALIPGALLSWLVSSAIGSQGSRGGWLAIGRVHIQDNMIYWSWPLFFLGVALAWILFTLTPK
jgi:hypothetical protein